MPDTLSRPVQRDPASRRTLVLAAVAVVAAAVAAYHNSFQGPLVFDDFPAISDNPTIRAWSAGVLSPPEQSGVGGRPLANLSYALNYAISGTSVRGYHVVNLLLHVGTALGLFGIVRRTLDSGAKCRAWSRDAPAAGFDGDATRAPHPRETHPDRMHPHERDVHEVHPSQARVREASALALTVALTWCVHPLTTAAVTYISQRTELMMAFFYILTLYAFIRGAQAPQSRWLGVSVVACAAGMMSKEVMVTAPVVVLLYDRTFVTGSFPDAWRRRRLYYIGLAATWIILGYLLTTGLEQRGVGFSRGVSPSDYALTAAGAIVRYVGLAIWPSPLVFDYGPVYSRGTFGAMAAGLLLLLFLASARAAIARRSAAGFAAVVFFLLLSPTSSFVPVADQPIAENRMYLPLAALTVLAVAALHNALGRHSRMILLPVVLGLGSLTILRNADYRGELALWKDTVHKRPENPRAQFNYGVVLLNHGRAREAIAHFEEAIQLQPEHAEAHNSLGNAWLELGQLPASIDHYAQAARLRPHYARAWYNYGTALLRRGDAPGAIARLEEALRHAPDFAEAHLNLGNAFFATDQPARAISHYQRALQINPALADAHYNCGSACFELGRFEEAVGHFAEAARLKPDDPEVRNHHGAALLRAGRPAEAIAQFEHALRLKPDYSDARSNLELARARR